MKRPYDSIHRFLYQTLDIRPQIHVGKLPHVKEKKMVICKDCEKPKHPLTICYSHQCIQRRRFEGNKKKAKP